MPFCLSHKRPPMLAIPTGKPRVMVNLK
jgi:hypothetical protein